MRKNTGFHKQEKRKKELKRQKKQEEKRAKRLNKARETDEAPLGQEEDSSTPQANSADAS